MQNLVPKKDYFDVVIVGGGLAGLTAAYRLANLSIPDKPSVLVLDAGNVVQNIGGRTGSVVIDNKTVIDQVSVGGTWLQFEDDDILGLAVELKCIPEFAKLRLDAPAFEDLPLHPWFFGKLWKLGKKVNHVLETPPANRSPADVQWIASLDQITLHQWVQNHKHIFTTKKGEEAVRSWFAMMENDPWDLNEMSALWSSVMVYQRLAAKNMLEQRTGRLFPQTLKWAGGTGSFIEAIVKKCETLGVKWYSDSPVLEIKKKKNSEYVVSYDIEKRTQVHGIPELASYHPGGSKKGTVRCKQVIIATSPSIITNKKGDPKKIYMHDSLNLDKKYFELAEAITPWDDAAFNVILRFDTKLWLDGNRKRVFLLKPSQYFQVANHHFFGTVMDLTEGSRDIIRVLADPHRIKNVSRKELEQEVLEFLYASYKDDYKFDDFKKSLIDMTIVNWTDCKPRINVTYYWKPNAKFNEYFDWLAKPHEGIHFAGAERSLQGSHWMEGAVHSGNLVAAEVAQDLGKLGGPGRNSPKEYLKSIEKSNRKGVKTIRKLSPSVVSQLVDVADVVLRGSTNDDQDKIESTLKKLNKKPKTLAHPL